MRYLYVLALVLFTGMYTFSNGYVIHGGGDDDDDKKNEKKDDDDSGGSGSNNNYLEVNTQTSLQFSVTQPEQFENVQTVHNAIKLQFKTKSKNADIYAKVADYSPPSGADRANIPIALKHSQDNSGNAYSLVTTPLQLTYQDQRLFVQPKANQAFNFFYDLQLLPLGYDYPEGQYNFTIMFTMTQP
jgi:lipopolysaccharide export system protein LptC